MDVDHQGNYIINQETERFWFLFCIHNPQGSKHPKKNFFCAAYSFSTIYMRKRIEIDSKSAVLAMFYQVLCL